MTKQQTIITISAAIAISMLICTIIIIIFYKQMKQSIKGTLGKSFFTIEELSESNTAKQKGINNSPPEDVKIRMQALIDNVLDPARKEYGSFIRVNSGYRSPALNTAVGGAKNSQHLTGEAADITTGSIEKDKLLFRILVQQGNFDQLIWEKPKNTLWIHVSYNASGRNRGQILSYNGKQYTNINNNWETAIA